MSLRIRTLDTFDDAAEALRAYVGAGYAAFGFPVDQAHLLAKATLVDPARYLLAEWDGEPVGGAGSYPLELTLPGGTQVPVAAVSDVGVAPSHRRHGVATELMRLQLRSFVDAGVPLAVLHASEAGIYSRFGFGACTRWRQVSIDARRVQFRADFPEVGGSLRVVQREDALEVCARVHDHARRVTNGGLSRPDSWWPVIMGDTDVYLGGTKDHLVMTHRGDDGHVDGYAIYKVDHDWDRGQANHTVRVWELLGETPRVELALWRALVEHDLIASVTGPIAVDHPLFDVALDCRQVGSSWEQDLLWARPLDVERLLSSRRYSVAGRLVLRVDDPLLADVGGCFALEVDHDGVAKCSRTSELPQIQMGISELGRVLLGGCSFRQLARAGQVSVLDDEAGSDADSLFRVDPLPWSWVRF